VNRVIVVGILLVAAFAGGFVPQYLKASRLGEEAQGLRDQLDRCQSEKKLSDFRSGAGVLYVEVARNNYSVAAEESTKFFTQLREFATQTPDAGLKSRLEDVLTLRDRITAGLAKADPAVAGEVQDLFLKLQKI
jgi:hypothetical protein